MKLSTRSSIPTTVWRNTVFCCLVQALNEVGPQVMVVIGALAVVKLTGSVLFVGVAVTLMQASRLLVSYPLGKIADTFGRRLAILVGLGFSLIGAPLVAASIIWGWFALFLVSTIVFGMGIGATQQLRVAVADMYPPQKRGKALGYLLTGSLLGTIVSPAILFGSDTIANNTSISNLALPFFALPFLMALSILLLSRVRPDPKQIGSELEQYWPGQKEMDSPGKAPVNFNLKSFLKSRTILTAAVCFAPAQGVMSMLMASTPLVLDNHGHSLTMISIAITIHVFGMYALSVPLGYVADRAGRKFLLVMGLLTGAIGAILVPITGLYLVIALGIFLVGLGWSAVFVAVLALIADATSAQERGRAVGINETLAACFSIGLPTLGGVMAANWGLLSVGLVGGLLMLIPLPLALALKARPQNQEA